MQIIFTKKNKVLQAKDVCIFKITIIKKGEDLPRRMTEEYTLVMSKKNKFVEFTTCCISHHCRLRMLVHYLVDQ